MAAADRGFDLTELESQFVAPVARDVRTSATDAPRRDEPTPIAPPAGPNGQAGWVPARPPRARWQQRHVAAVVLSDLAVLLVAASAGVLAGSGDPGSPALGAESLTMGVATVVLVLTCLKLTRAWEPSALGQGAAEFSRLTKSFVGAGVLLGLAALLSRHLETRPWVFVVIPLAGLLAALARYGLRKLLHRRRRLGRCVHRVLAVGTEASVAELIGRTRRDLHNGWVVAGACTPTGSAGDGETGIAGVPVIGDLDSLGLAVRHGRYAVVAIATAPGWTAKRLQRLAWDLEGTGADLVVHPGLMEVAGPRLHVTPVDGLPLLRLTEPTFTGLPRVIKNVVDRTAAALLLVLLAPLLAAIAVARTLDGGPVLHRRLCVGRGGRPFRALRFSSAGRSGGVLHRWCLDELPQLCNVLAGSMSLVGPRPPAPNEVAEAPRDVARRLLVKPGLTGLWQVSGHRELSWDESVRLDLRYVENWTLALDALILWKTLEAVLRGDGVR